MRRLRKIQSAVVAAAVVLALAAAGSVLAEPQAHAAQTGGTAPIYLNQWMVSGPYTDPVVEQTAAPVVPALGASLVDPNSKEASTWQYFDDRIFNRNYDDYNDLMGYLDVKQGQPTANKWVVAASYVYSPVAQTVQWQVGGSGLYRLFANDAPVGRRTPLQLG